MDNILTRLCRHAGLATDYHDIWGNRHTVAEPHLRALLAELGVPEVSEAALQAAEDAGWRQPLPPLAAIAADEAGVELPLRLPDDTGRVRWALAEEGGRVHHGEFDWPQAAVQAAREVDGRWLHQRVLRLALALPAGYHRFSIDGWASHTLLVAAPARCYRPPALQDEGRVWGPAVQLYALRSERNWGIGDFGDLGELIEAWSERGAGVVGLNPLHALFAHNPSHVSPYSPSSRLQLNALYLDIEAIDDFREHEAAQAHVRSAAFQQRLASLRAAEPVDYPGVSAAKHEVLALLWAHFRERHLRTASARGAAFRAFQRERGLALRRHALFEALQQHFHAADASVWGWPVWPEAYRDPQSDAVQRFARDRTAAVEFFEYLQWQADLQLQQLNRRCRERGLAVGLYLDLAVSVDRAGSDTWAHQALYCQHATVGAPPDEVNRNGQSWGLPPLRPDRLQQDDGCAFFIDTLRASMRHAGALRIDHVMGLMRLYWIAPGASARDGAYVHYPLQALMAIVALESVRNRCLVIGEDLGTVADEMRDALARRELLSYRLLYFERQHGGAFKPPAQYPREALVAVSTHDLGTFAGWWTGHDLQVRQALSLYPDQATYEQQLVDRTQDRLRLLIALQHEGLLPDGIAIDPTVQVPLSPELVQAVHAYAAAAPSRVMMLQLEDALGLIDQANLPGTVDEHPNWRRKLPLSVEATLREPTVQALVARLAAIRPHAPVQRSAAPTAQAVVPRATYRLQFHAGFTLDDGLAVLPYLQRLGISHVYCSPLMRARPGSTHGYDVVAHDEINPELGGRDAFDRFSAALRERGMGLLLDMVPNHMGVLGGDNAWWMDVLEHGEASPYARYFDINWHPVDRDLDGQVLLPVLGEHVGAVLESGQLQLVFEADAGSFALRYFEHRFPLDPRCVEPLLQRAAAQADSAELASLAAAFGHLPAREATAAEAVAERLRDSALLKQRLATLVHEQPALQAAIDSAVAQSQTADALDVLQQAQAYRLAYWRVAGDEINYRRFFDVNELAALRQEEPAVFEATQGFALELAAAGQVDGLRIDHPDGLHDPAQYFRRLQQGYARRRGLSLPEAEPQGRPARPLYVVAEKIAASHEDVPEQWALHGTTGYRFANVVNGVLIDTRARERFDRIWQRFTGDRSDFEELAYEGKREVMRGALAAELTVLATELLRIARGHRRTRDHTYNSLRDALAEVAACMPVYRTYIVEQPSATDQRFIDWAVAQARRRSHAADRSIFDFVRQTLLAQAEDPADEALQQRVRRFAMRFQQFTAPVTAKGVEDTAFYRYSRLVSLNEVGGDPGTFGLSLRGFHAASADRAARWPHTIVATSTHDNKRSEDVRCRLDVLSELPAAWRLALRRFSRAPQLERVRSEAGHEPAPSRADEYLLYQTLLGTLPAGGLTDEQLPAYRERIQRYMQKAAREAKRHTSWTSPNAEYEEAVSAFVHSVLARVKPNPLLTDLQQQAEILAWFGAWNSLTMTVLKFTAPGVPDLYQGNEWMDLSLVDPDNRRPVDYGLRAQSLEAFERIDVNGDPALADMAATPHDGRLKLWTTWRLLQLRRERWPLFCEGSYAALEVSGQRSEHVIAHVREAGGDRVFTVAGRFFAQLMQGTMDRPLGAAWADTAVALPGVGDGAVLRDVVTGRTVSCTGGRVQLAALLALLPAAVLVEQR
jgi:(1->4)-alpha-D-glucan 1-alpha-D-glucosylmutase